MNLQQSLDLRFLSQKKVVNQMTTQIEVRGNKNFSEVNRVDVNINVIAVA